MIRRSIDPHRDSAQDLKWRDDNNAVLQQVAREHALRPLVTAENVTTELEWQRERINELMRERGWK